MKTENFKDF